MDGSNSYRRSRRVRANEVRLYRKITIAWKFSYKSIAQFHGKIDWECYIQIHVITMCVIKLLHCILTHVFRLDFFISWFKNPPIVIFQKVEKKKILIFFISFYPPTLNIIWKKKNIFLRFCLCTYESNFVKSDCPVQIFRKMMKYLKI